MVLNPPDSTFNQTAQKPTFVQPLPVPFTVEQFPAPKDTHRHVPERHLNTGCFSGLGNGHESTLAIVPTFPAKILPGTPY